MSARLAFLLGLLITGFSSEAGPRPWRTLLFGPEWEFTNKVLRKSPSKLRGGGQTENLARRPFADAIADKIAQSPGEIRREKNPFGIYTFWLPDGSGFELTLDPAVIEVIGTPKTIAEYKRDQAIFQKYVFDAAAEAGFFYHPDFESAQIHFDFKAAFGNPDGTYDYMLFRNFLVDFYNHSEIYLGALEDDPVNAPDLNRKQRQRLAGLLDGYDHFFTAEGMDPHSVHLNDLVSLISEINGSVYKSAHYSALNLTHAHKGGSVEIRPVRMRSLGEWIKVLEVFEARLNYVAGIEHFLPLNLKTKRPSKKQIEKGFRKYVTEPGLRWSTYKSLLKCEAMLAVQRP